MTEEELALFDDMVLDAKTDADRSAVIAKWLPHFARCLISTNRHVKKVEAAIDALNKKIDRLHSKPLWKDDKMGWLLSHWLEIAVFLYLLKSFGVEIGPIAGALLGT